MCVESRDSAKSLARVRVALISVRDTGLRRETKTSVGLNGWRSIYNSCRGGRGLAPVQGGLVAPDRGERDRLCHAVDDFGPVLALYYSCS